MPPISAYAAIAFLTHSVVRTIGDDHAEDTDHRLEPRTQELDEGEVGSFVLSRGPCVFGNGDSRKLKW
jgi:hypothetical protein